MYTEDFKNEVDNELNADAVIKKIEEILTGARQKNTTVSISFSGGDPFLFDGFYRVLDFCKGKLNRIGILGNPNFVDVKSAQKLKDVGVSTYQISLEGPEDINDALREKGSFKEALRAIKILNDVGIDSHVMMTISKTNHMYLEEVMDIADINHVKLFAFARLCASGEGKNLSDGIEFDPNTYKMILYRYLEKHKRLLEKGTKTYFGRKDHLFTLLYSDIGLVPGSSEFHEKGCGVGSSTSILPDGTVYACRRFPSHVGNIKDENYWEVYNGEKMGEYKKFDEFVKCSTCQLLEVCRGCPAVSYGLTNNFYEADPQCWK